jgi:hypothetical protein
MNAITDREENRACEALLRAQLSERAELVKGRELGFQGGSITADVLWHTALGIWASIDGPVNWGPNDVPRFWNAFGTQNAHDSVGLSIVCEVNVSYEGANPRVGGLFAKGHDDHTYLLHTGKIGGGRAGVGQTLFWENWPYRKTSVARGRSVVDCAIVAEIDSPQAAFEIARFVIEVQRIKALVT